MRTIPADIHIEDGKEVRISTYETSGWLMRFRAIGDLNNRNPDSMDAVEQISEFTKAELFLFRVVCGCKDESNKLTLRLRKFSPADQAKLKKAVRLWIKKGLLVRMKREHYMVNPWFLVPPKGEQLNAMNQWKALSP